MSQTLTDKQISTLHKNLAMNFYDNDLYKIVFRNEETRLKALEKYFKYYLKAKKKTSCFLADDEEMHSVIVAYDSRKANFITNTLSFIWMNIKMISIFFTLHSLSDSIHAIKNSPLYFSMWRNDFVKEMYYHININFTQNKYRSLGYNQKLVESFIESADNQEMDIILDTFHEENVAYFQQFSFVLLKEVSHGSQITRYCMLRRHV